MCTPRTREHIDSNLQRNRPNNFVHHLSEFLCVGIINNNNNVIKKVFKRDVTILWELTENWTFEFILHVSDVTRQPRPVVIFYLYDKSVIENGYIRVIIYYSRNT